MRLVKRLPSEYLVLEIVLPKSSSHIVTLSSDGRGNGCAVAMSRELVADSASEIFNYYVKYELYNCIISPKQSDWWIATKQSSNWRALS